MKQVLVAISGGVDSAFAAYSLKKKGFDVKAIFFKLHKNQKQDFAFENAKIIAENLKVDFFCEDLTKEFEEIVIQDFLKQYQSGLTPNPCVFCNQNFKFNFLQKKANEMGISFIATGHYAILEDGFLKKAFDQSKDQSYFLYRLLDYDLEKIIFPLGIFLKKEVKEVVFKIFPEEIFEQKESQDLCFLNQNLIDFLKKRLDKKLFKTGDVYFNGKKIADHQGVLSYTIGQKAKISGQKNPLFVSKIDFENNIIEVSENQNLFSDSFQVDQAIGLEKVDLKKDYQVQIRFRGIFSDCKIIKKDQFYEILLKKPLRAITAGQSAVFYDQDRLVGGGVIRFSDF